MRTLKEQCLYLHRFTSLTAARAIIGEVIARCNAEWLIERLGHRNLRPRGPRRWRRDHGHPRNAIAPGRQDDDRRRSYTVTSLSDAQETGCGTQSAIGRNLTDGVVVRVARLVYGSARETSDRLTAYVQALYPVLGDYLPE